MITQANSSGWDASNPSSAGKSLYGKAWESLRTACGTPFLKTTEGVAHPVLPCGVRLYIRFNGREVLTQVVDRGPNVPGREFDITKALANRLDLHGTQTIQWRFAR